MMKTLQEILVQPGPDGTLLLTPAWPKDWSARFRLHVAGNIFIEGRIEQGKLIDWKTTPESTRSRVRLLGTK
jgi:hypothetical protein